MQSITEYFGVLMNSEEIIRVGGLVLITLIVYAETGLFFCFWLPGDYLLFLAGIFCATGALSVSIYQLALCLFTAAFLGNYTGYLFGRYLGDSLMTRPDTLFFKKKYMENTQKIFTRYGGQALVVGRFLPIVRTFAPILAGVARLSHSTFLFYNFIGALLWVMLLTVSGYLLGNAYKDTILNYTPYIIIGFISFTSITVINSYLKVRRDNAKSDKAAEKAALEAGK